MPRTCFKLLRKCFVKLSMQKQFHAAVEQFYVMHSVALLHYHIRKHELCHDDVLPPVGGRWDKKEAQWWDEIYM